MLEGGYGRFSSPGYGELKRQSLGVNAMHHVRGLVGALAPPGYDISTAGELVGSNNSRGKRKRDRKYCVCGDQSPSSRKDDELMVRKINCD